ncbi:branched-chain amino acid transport ATP-binding protein LivG [Desulfocucumis palustris]|uniref:Branched-chain amino acid transport ATP-binding protein LivG n=1 Tax=Desulfocucumis palustris TaxID=1898651 RepID=A0A2L2XLU2_9FIRM|nr:ABC transporter ATP-binding protein [Desulfocucumis palustris]GBF34931.1 branched-chain amino acid transport ATP-binding protein LivG [Desulfocucumis palustris]
MLKCDSVSVVFGGLTAVNKVSFNVDENEILGMIGPNGAGKTTLFNAICGDAKSATGKVSFEDRDITPLTTDSRCRLGIGRTFQIPQLFETLTVKENIMIGALCRVPNISSASEIAEKIMELLEIKDLGAHYPAVLTIGQRKRLELSRALATQPKLLLLDEIMGGLHYNEVEETVALLKRIREQGITIFMIEHVISAVVSLCDRVTVMNRGGFIAQGTPSEVMENNEVINAYLGRAEDA